MLCLLILVPACVFLVMAPGPWLTIVSIPYSLCYVDTMIQSIAPFRYGTTQTTSQYMVQSHHTGVCGTSFYAGLYFGGKKYASLYVLLCILCIGKSLDSQQ